MPERALASRRRAPQTHATRIHKMRREGRHGNRMSVSGAASSLCANLRGILWSGETDVQDATLLQGRRRIADPRLLAVFIYVPTTRWSNMMGSPW